MTGERVNVSKGLVDALRADYETVIRGQLDPDGPEAALLREMRAAAERRRAAMTPEERTIEDLTHRVDELEARIEHARLALAGEDCGYREC